MALYHILVLAVIQGISEFLPISSSGHLVVTSKVLEWPDQGLLIDVAVHVGTLFAVAIYFWKDLFLVLAGITRLFLGRRGRGVLLASHILIATVPVIVVGYFAKDYVVLILRDIEVIAWATIGFGILLWVADHLGMTFRRLEHLSIGHAVFIGMAQILALIPGTSRSGITITAGRLLGMERAEAARFSMLLSIPVISGAGIIGLAELIEKDSLQLSQDAMISAGLAFVVGFIAISFLMSWLRRSSFTPFVIYRMFLGGFLLYWVHAPI